MWSKAFHIKVDKFFLFFDIGGVKLFSTRSKWFRKLFPSSEKWETEYGIGWLPLGGYCKIAGMVDESMDLESLKGEPEEWEFRSHSAPQRLLVMAGGVLNNFIFAILAFIFIVFIWGQSFYSAEGHKIYVNELAYEMGFRSGDEILSFDGRKPGNFWDLQADLARRDVRYARVLRDGDTLDLYIDRSMVEKVLNTPGMFDIAVPFVIDSLLSDGPNAGSALQRGDRIVALDSVAVPWFQDGRKYLASVSGTTVNATVERDTLVIDMPLAVDTLGRIGIMARLPELDRREYSFLESIPQGAALAWENVSGYCRDLKLLARPSTGAYKSVGSFIAIGQVFPSTWDWYRFLYLMAMLSIMLAVMNLLPIPGLDGGHMLFTIYEMITGRKPSERFLAIAQMIGLLLLLALMFLAFGNDITNYIIR
ncbi:MAG: RIP metalloprotease RseP [Bacteroidales bacterium]|nr:RIP metalloprotease RseP [Bacteroidales bacterium]